MATKVDEKKVEEIRDKWWRIGTDIGVTDKEKAYHLILKAYKEAGYTPPPKKEFHFFENLEAANDYVYNRTGEIVFPFYGLFESSWMAYYEYAHLEGHSFPPYIWTLMELCKLTSWIYFFDEMCVVVVKPSFIGLDEQLRFHSETRKALEYPDGWGLYVHHNIIVPEKVIVAPETQTVEEILAEKNSEIRRIRIEKFGAKRLILEGNPAILDEDQDSQGLRTLYSLNLPNHPFPINMIRWRTITQDKEEEVYFERVDPKYKTCQEAAAGSFLLDVKDYHPDVES